MFHMTGKYKSLPNLGGGGSMMQRTKRNNDENMPLNAMSSNETNNKKGYELSHVLEDVVPPTNNDADTNIMEKTSSKTMQMQQRSSTNTSTPSTCTALIVSPTTANNAYASTSVFRDNHHNGVGNHHYSEKNTSTTAVSTVLQTAPSRDYSTMSARHENIPPPLDGDPTISETFDEADDDYYEQTAPQDIENANSIIMMDVLKQCQNLKEENAFLTNKLHQAEEMLRQMMVAQQAQQQQQVVAKHPTRSTKQRRQVQTPFPQVSSSPWKAMNQQVPGLTTASFDTYDQSMTSKEFQIMAQNEIPFQVPFGQGDASWGGHGHFGDQHTTNFVAAAAPDQGTGPFTTVLHSVVRPTSSNDSVSTLSRTGTFDTADMSLGSSVYLGARHARNPSRDFNTTTHSSSVVVPPVAVSSSSSYHTATAPSLGATTTTPSKENYVSRIPQAQQKPVIVRYESNSNSSLSGHPGAKNNAPSCLSHVVDSAPSDHPNRDAAGYGTSTSSPSASKINNHKKKGRSYSMASSANGSSSKASSSSLSYASSSTGKEEHSKRKNGGLKSIFKTKSSSSRGMKSAGATKASTATKRHHQYSSSVASSTTSNVTEVAGNTIEHNLSRSHDDDDEEFEALAEI